MLVRRDSRSTPGAHSTHNEGDPGGPLTSITAVRLKITKIPLGGQDEPSLQTDPMAGRSSTLNRLLVPCFVPETPAKQERGETGPKSLPK